MKTIKAIFTNELTTDIGGKKQYSFNVSQPVKEGDLLITDLYNKKLQVTEILNDVFKFVTKNGVLTNTSDNAFPIKHVSFVLTENA